MKNQKHVGDKTMNDAGATSRGYALIAALLMLMLLSSMAIGLFMLTSTERRTGNNDLENNLAYYGASAGMEKMTSDLATLYTVNQAPSLANVQALSANPPDVPGVTFTEYFYNVPSTNGVINPPIIDNVHTGQNQGLVAQIIPMTLQVTSTRPGNAQVRMLRTVEVALIPVFQFGVFSDSDLSFFNGPNFDFAGRVHSNGNMFLTPGGSLTFHAKVTSAGEIVRDKLANGVDGNASGHGGPVFLPNTAAGCDAGAPPLHCINLGMNQGSWLGGVPPVTGAANNAWTGISTGTYASWVVSRANALRLPFVAGGADPVEIIRQPPPGEVLGAGVSPSRLYNQAQIRVLMADTLADLHAAPYDADDVLLDNFPLNANYPLALFPGGAPAGGPFTTYAAGVPVAGVGNMYFGVGDPVRDADFRIPRYLGAVQVPVPTRWPLVGGFLRVEVRNCNGCAYRGVTREWLAFGFSRGLTPPVAPGANPINANAILLLQMQADRNGDGVLGVGDGIVLTNAGSENSWFPLNFYDTREGEVRDVVAAGSSCSVNGIMDTVELDVGNLRRWLTGAVAGTGNLVDSNTLNGYLFYFSDRRGMRNNPNIVPAPPQPIKNGEYGFEDTINGAVAAGTPNGALEANNPGTVQSPEDVDRNGLLDNWGAVDVGDGFGLDTNTTLTNAVARNPYQRTTCFTVGRKNRVTGARHTIMLVDGTLGNLPTRPNGTGGFTVGSENPLYIVGNYNATAAGFGANNAAAAVIADTVTVLSSNWNNTGSTANNTRGSMEYPTLVGNRDAASTFYRVAIAAGKNMNFPQPAGFAAAADYGTDGGMHNFLQYLENWGGQNLNYRGSLVSLYYSQYATSIYKCCTTVYNPPTRNYAFDVLFLTPANLPPGTPMFRDVANVSYRQDFRPPPF
jgi:Tfp pilus assembly protein PilX